MKATLYSSNGEKKGTIDLPKVFDAHIRADIVQKYFETDKSWQPYAAKFGAGLRQVAFGSTSHKRHDWKGQYGRGTARVPRKTMSRRGTQFHWVAANMPGVRGGRKAHPPQVPSVFKKMNKKEIETAFNSAYAATAHKNLISQRYATIKNVDAAPFVIESLPQKAKDFVKTISAVFGENTNLAFKKKEIRAGIGKSRNRKYKSNAGALIVVGKDENKKYTGIDVKSLNEIKISDLYPLGRLTLYTKKALDEFSKTLEAKK